MAPSKKPTPPENKLRSGPPATKAPAEAEAPVVPPSDAPEAPAPVNVKPAARARTVGFLKIPKES